MSRVHAAAPRVLTQTAYLRGQPLPTVSMQGSEQKDDSWLSGAVTQTPHLKSMEF